MLLPETVLQGRYRITRQLGQGGMGAVYEAIDERLDTTVALKETLFADERLRKQFEREARLLARMHHPALPRVSDHFSEDGGQFLVMQFIPGDDLLEMIAHRGGPFPPEQVLSWGDQLLDALDYLHTQNPQIVHRDIKPQNLKLTARGQVVLLDFGLAKGQTSEVSRLTGPASIFGYTPNYAPLEQIQGLGTDARSDIYALGATLYHLMTRVKPPDAVTRAAAIVNGQMDPLKSASEVNPAVSSETTAVLKRAMAQNREQRYASAVEMRRALQSSGEGRLVGGRSEAETVLLPPATVTVSAATKANDKPETVRTGETTVVRNPQLSEKRKTAPWAIAIAVLAFMGVAVGGFYAFRHKSSSAPQSLLTSSPANTADVPSGGHESTAPGSHPIDKVDKVDKQTPQRPAEAESANKRAAKAQEKAAQEKDKQTAARESSSGSGSKSSGTKRQSKEKDVEDPELPEPPDREMNPSDLPLPPRGRRGPVVVRGADGTIIKKMPDGTQLITTPDGTRVLVRPNGSRRVFRPGEKFNRRRGP